MALVKGDRYRFTEDNVSKAPDQEGVYMIVDSGDNPIYIGRGNVRERLKSHYHRREATDECIWNNNPTHYYREPCWNSEQREEELLHLMPTACNLRY